MSEMLRASEPDRCDIRIADVLRGCLGRWAFDHRWIQTALPPDAAGRMVGQMGKAQAGENVQADAYRSRIAFGLQK